MKTTVFPYVGKCVQILLPAVNLCYSLVKGGATNGANIIPCNPNDLSQRICILPGSGDNFIMATRDCVSRLDNRGSMDGPGFMYLNDTPNPRHQEFRSTKIREGVYHFNLLFNGYGMGYSGGPGP